MSLYNGKEAAKKLNISEEQLSAFARDGEISYINVGRGTKRPSRRYTDEDLEAFKELRRRREVCLSTSPKSRHFTNTISSSKVVGFSARLSAQRAKKPNDLKL
jgi:hypothetical protein